MTTSLNIEAILGRPEHPPDIDTPLRELRKHRVLVTGADGSIGSAITQLLNDSGVSTIGTDIDDCDVTNSTMLADVMARVKPTLVFHLACLAPARRRDRPARRCNRKHYWHRKCGALD